MYHGAIDGIHAHLIRKSEFARLTYTSELIPERGSSGQMCDFFPPPSQFRGLLTL